ncbi:MAG: tryptophan synthase subunit beta [Spirochaetes bacterium GWD1_27_9]|nr:MAG: tryptophan synthase subunit beta [Spirochaetes bacterium GWB1_27_13]OHD21930.1 MAG: tryptophan synthase subunit beta [Spirochaetes bacterium GWC1_27_15]OHD36560.1 MAG: tryptophan synthase subunit beta [Spirochaetes bacterium GWD1_27_9]
MQTKGFYDEFGGIFIPEVLNPVINELINVFENIKQDKSFWDEYTTLLENFSGRPTPLTFAGNLTKHFNKGKIFLKREDLNHSGAHKINNVMGQGLLMRRLGKTRVIAETGAGQHGVATAIMAAKFGYKATIYMGIEDVERQYSNVFWMKKLGATVVPVVDGAGTLKDAINEALRDWVGNFDTTHYCLGTASGTHPFPEMVAYFQSIIGKEVKKQITERENRLPSKIYACVGGGSNALGIFGEFLKENTVELIGVEAGGMGADTDMHASRLAYKTGKIGVAQGYRTYFLQDEDGQMKNTYSIAAGLDYMGVSPILASLYKSKRVRFEAATDKQVLEAFQMLLSHEGIIPALESTHALAKAIEEIEKSTKDDIIIVNLSGRGDKDIFNIADAFLDNDWVEFIKKKNDYYKNVQKQS